MASFSLLSVCLLWPGDNGNGNSNNGGNNNGGNNNSDGPQSFGNSDGNFGRFAQFLGNSLLGAVVLVASVAAFPAASSAAMANLATGNRAKAYPQMASSSIISAGRTRSKVLHVACKGSTLVVPLSDPQVRMHFINAY